jgi:hypothetical protein
LFGWIPFSIGDLIYFALIMLALAYLYRNRKSIWKNKLSFARNVLMILSVAYFTFHFMWGMNYYREPLADKLELTETRDYNELLYFSKQVQALLGRNR